MTDQKDLNKQAQVIDEMGQTEQQQPVTEENLEKVSGGATFGICDTVARYDSNGNSTHWRDSRRRGRIFYFICPKCGELLHQGAFGRLYCDPCNEGWFAISLPDSCKCYDGRFKYAGRYVGG